MAYAGQILENPLSGERIVFRKTAADTGGELLVFELFLTPDGHVPVVRAVRRGLDERYRRVSVDGTPPAHAGPSYPVAGEEVA